MEANSFALYDFNSRSLYYLFQVGKEKGKGKGREDEETPKRARIGKGLKIILYF